jgi:hypothetical protein
MTADSYRFIATDDLGVGCCIRRAGESTPEQVNDTPSLCGRVLVGSRYTLTDEPDPACQYTPEMVATKRGPLPRWCSDCLRIWRHETGQVANDNAADLKAQALDDLREELRRARRDHDRYVTRVGELDARMEAIRLITRGEWCAVKAYVDEYCERMGKT